MAKTPTAKDAKKYQEQLYEANRVLTRETLCTELRNDETVQDLADTLIRILKFEFGEGYTG